MCKVLRKTLAIIFSVVVAAPLLAMGGVALYDTIAFNDYYKNSEKLYKIPGINDGYIPQGLAYSKKYDVFLNTGYMKKSSDASRIYISKEDGSDMKFVSLKYKDELFTKHNGGIGIHGEMAYISTASKLYSLSMKDLVNANNGDYVNILGEQKVHTNSSFCFASDSMMYVGEFCDDGKYKVDETHHIKNGDQEHHALVLAYPFIGDIVSPLPQFGYSVLDCAQGMCITDSNKIVISTSRGLDASKLVSYKVNANTKMSLFKNDDFLTPVVISFLGTNELVNEIKGPAMNEEIEYKDGYIYVNNESACNKYIFGKFTRAKYIYRIKAQ